MSEDGSLALVAVMQSQLERLPTSLALLRSHIEAMDRPQPVEPPPEAERLIADFDVEALDRAAPCTAQFRDRSRGAVTSWWWNFGNGNTSRERNPTFNYRIGDTKDVTLVVANEKSDKSTKTVQGTLRLASPVSRSENAGSLADLPVLMRSMFRDSKVGRSWRSASGLILSRLEFQLNVSGWDYGIESWQSRNNAHVGISRPGSSHPPSQAIEFPKHDESYR